MKKKRQQYRVHYSIENSLIFKTKREAEKFINGTPGLRIHAVFLDDLVEETLTHLQIRYAKGKFNI